MNDALKLPLKDFVPDPEPMTWYRKRMPGLRNAGGSENWMYIKKGTGNGLIVFFIGGGFSINEEMARYPGSVRDFFEPRQVFYTDECHPNNEYYFFRVLGNHGLFSTEKENWFADWSVAMINYGTADMHIGDRDFPYTDLNGEKKVLHHHGYRNFRASLECMKGLFPSPDRLLITGCSAGGFGAAALADEVIEAYQDCENRTVCIDSSVLRVSEWPRIVREVWNAPKHIADRVTTDNIVLDFVRTKRQEAKYLFICGCPDGALSTFQNYMDTGAFEATESARNRTADIIMALASELRKLGVGIYLHQFMKDGLVQHCTLDARTFRDSEVPPMEWLWEAAVNDRISVKTETVEATYGIFRRRD